MNTYLDDELNVQIADLESIIQRFVELFDENDGVPVMIAEDDEVVDLLNDAAVILDRDYDEVS